MPTPYFSKKFVLKEGGWALTRYFTVLYITIWGPEQLVGSVWARCPQRRGFDPPLGKFSREGDFSLGVNMASNSIPPKQLFRMRV